MSDEAPVPASTDITDLLLTGRHPLLRIGAHKDALTPFVLWNSPELDPGAPLGGDVEFGDLRFCIGLDGTDCLSYWVLKQSLQDRSFLFMAANKEIRLGDIDAFGFLRVLEELRVPYTREIWGNSVCVVTILQSGVSVSFDLEPFVAKGFAAIELGAVPLYIGGDVFRRITYDQPS